MFGKFFSGKTEPKTLSESQTDFSYLSVSAYYFDSACQTLRPQCVIDAEVQYYHEYNSCGHRVKYKWGEKTDQQVTECRENILKLVNKSSPKYAVAFGLNTTQGINQILHQLPVAKFSKIVTSDIEHNSVFLPTLTWAKLHKKPRIVLDRSEDGSLIYQIRQLENAIVLLNTTSNIDGRELLNIEKLVEDTHNVGGIVLLDICQTLAHNPKLLKDVEFDAAFGSGHKMYGPSVGFTIIKSELLKELDCYLIGGSTVQDVKLDSYELIEDENEIYARIEPGLQNYAGIVGLNRALKWLDEPFEIPPTESVNLNITNIKTKHDWEKYLSDYLHQKLKEVPNITLLNQNSSAIVSLYSSKIDAHKLAMYLSEAGIMCRSGYHCCHYYLKEKSKLPPLFRISLGLNNSPAQIDFLIKNLKTLCSV